MYGYTPFELVTGNIVEVCTIKTLYAYCNEGNFARILQAMNTLLTLSIYGINTSQSVLFIYDINTSLDR